MSMNVYWRPLKTDGTAVGGPALKFSIYKVFGERHTYHFKEEDSVKFEVFDDLNIEGASDIVDALKVHREIEVSIE